MENNNDLMSVSKILDDEGVLKDAILNLSFIFCYTKIVNKRFKKEWKERKRHQCC